MQSIRKKYWALRRYFLKNFVPEFIWPEYITLNSVDIPIRNMQFSFGTKNSLIKGYYEVAERQLLQNCLRPKDIVIEMGGSVGILTAIISRYVGPEGRVISVEASKKLTLVSKKWLLPKGNISIITGFGFPVFKLNNNLKIDKFIEDGGSLSGVVSFSSFLEENLKESDESDIWDLEKICRKYLINPTVLVLDIEGSETILVDHQPNFPKTIRMIMIELHPSMYDEKCKNNIITKIVSEGFILKETITTSYLFERA